MTFLDTIVNDIHAIEKAIFHLDSNTLETTMQRIENIGFVGQIDHNNLYMSILHQIRNDRNGEIHSVTEEEACEFYDTGLIKEWHGFKPFAWTFWFFNMDKNYIRALVSYHADANKRPKENYGIMYNDLKPQVVTKIPRKVIYETTIEESGYADTWTKLKEVIFHGKNNLIKTGSFCKRVTYDTAVYFGDREKDESVLLDDEYKETSRAELIKIPVKHKPQDIRYDVKALNIMRGAAFKQIDFENDGYIKEFDNIPELNSYFYSLIEYINSCEEKNLNNQCIPLVEKHYYSNKLPAGDTSKFYKVKMTNFLGKMVVEAEVAELGIYYKITNFNGRTFCENV
jgi:hypothetical protein